MSDAKRTPGKWRRGKGSEASRIYLDDPQGGPSKTVAELWYHGWTPAEIQEHAAFIVRAANAHDALVAACETMRTELAHLGKHDPHLEDNLVLPAVLDQAGAAIALAKEPADG